VRVQLRRKRYRSVLSETLEALNRFPDDPNLHAMRAVALAELGDYAEASMRLSDGLGAQEASMLTVVSQADVLRYFGAPGEAAEVRSELLASGESPHREQVMVMKLFDDHHMAHNLDGMWEAATTAMALNPASAVPYGLMARYYIALGDEEQAESYLWLVQYRGGNTATEGIARVEFALAFDQPDDAWLVANENRELVLRSKEFAVARGQALLAAGAWDEAQTLSDGRAWRVGDELWHPGLLAVQAMASAGLGWMDEAERAADRLRRAYPDDRLARQAVQMVESRSRGIVPTGAAGRP